MTSAREKLLRYYKGTEGEETAVRLVDLAEQAMRTQKFRLSGFLDGFGVEIAEAVAANYDGLHVDFDGGYQGAERQRAMLVHDAFGGHPEFNIVVLKAVWKQEFSRIGHRDVLGALMGLGIERDCLGDILMSGGTARIITDKKMAEFLKENCSAFGATAIRWEDDEVENIIPREEKTKDINATVASLRADAIAASGYGISRSKAAADIEAEKLKINWQTVKSASQTVKQGDVLSLRGRGRVEVAEVRGTTKKGRVSVLLKRFY